MAGFWRRLFGGQEKPPETIQHPAPPKVTTTPNHIKNVGSPLRLSDEARAEVLSQFRNGANPEQIPPEAWQEFWAQKLGMPFRQASQALFAEGLLCEASPAAKLSASRNLSELKAIAKKMGLKVSGRKDELAARLVDSADPGLLAELAKKNAWTCSDEARELVEVYREDKKARLHQTRLETLELLKDKKLKEACELVCQHEQAQFFPRGLGVDWFTADKELHKSLEAVFAAQPKFHKRRFGTVTSELRERAAMSTLWGTSHLGDIFPRDEQTENVELFSRMLEFHASYLRNLKQMNESVDLGLDLQCEIIAAEDQNTTCAACLDDNGQVYQLQDVPELPHEHCECAIGCRCNVVAKFPDDF